MYGIVNSDNEIVGSYSGKYPCHVAKKVAREIYKNGGSNGNHTFDFTIVNRATKETYPYKAKIYELKKPIEKRIGKSVFYEEYKIETKRM